jgi:hypothetical protein
MEMLGNQGVAKKCGLKSLPLRQHLGRGTGTKTSTADFETVQSTTASHNQLLLYLDLLAKAGMAELADAADSKSLL